MLREITINGTGTFTDLRALLAKVDEKYPEINDVTATVPYSGVEHNFTDIYGKKVYSYRDVIYTFKLWHPDAAVLEQRITRFINFMYALGDNLSIYDSGTTYHYTGRIVSIEKVSTTGEEYGARKFACTFRCHTDRTPNVDNTIAKDSTWWPDVNGDGVANASDAAMILQLAAAIGGGGDLPDWAEGHPEKVKMADANHDGVVNASDAAIVQQFAAAVGAGKYTDGGIDNWFKFLNTLNGNSSEVI